MKVKNEDSACRIMIESKPHDGEVTLAVRSVNYAVGFTIDPHIFKMFRKTLQEFVVLYDKENVECMKEIAKEIPF